MRGTFSTPMNSGKTSSTKLVSPQRISKGSEALLGGDRVVPGLLNKSAALNRWQRL